MQASTPSLSPPRTRRTNDGWRKGTSVDDTYAISPRPASAPGRAETASWTAALLEVLEDLEGVGKQGERLAR